MTLVLQWSLGGESPNAFRGKIAPSPTCSTWNTSATGPEGEATRLPLIARGSLGPAGLAASGSRPTRVSPDAPACELSSNRVVGRGERSRPSTSPPIPKLHPRRCSRDSRCATQRPRRSLRSGASRRPLYPWRQGSPAGCLGRACSLRSLSRAARGYLRKPSAGSSAVIGYRGRGERSYPSMSLAELRLSSRLRDSAALSMRPARCRNGMG